MTNKDINNKLLTLRDRQKLLIEEMDRLIETINEPALSPRKRRNLKKLRRIEAENRFIEKGVFNQNSVTAKTLKSQ